MIYKISFKKDILLAFTEWLLVIDFSNFDMLLVKEMEILNIEYTQGEVKKIEYILKPILMIIYKDIVQ